MIDSNEELKGNFIVSGGGDSITISAVKGGDFEGEKGDISAFSETGTEVFDSTSTIANLGTADEGSTTAATQATGTLTMPAFTSVDDLVGKGITINGEALEFYDASKGAYQGDAQGIDIGGAASKANVTDAIVSQAKIDGVVLENDGVDDDLKVTAAQGGLAGNEITTADGGIQEEFTATFQVGANKDQSMTIEIGDMRAKALGVTAEAGSEGFVNNNNVTNGTDNVTREAALDVSTHESATAAIETINNAIEKVSSQRSNLGAFQNRLEHTISNLGNASENLTAAESRIRDVDMAKEMMEMTRTNILSQASQSMLAQANQKPQSVLQLLG
ncbi:flagellin [Alteribacillus iranensis]|uniref:Flagellin n=1 Tax=Alteribacillus iranensis TaxID=930128 RepID=A0A1I2B7Q3_9BACI|nr:flagellin [Alteribacillus iranensis]SFE52232.1 flagellin [Alteribacillus iranensis]